jgi:hypothetical protein
MSGEDIDEFSVSVGEAGAWMGGRLMQVDASCTTVSSRAIIRSSGHGKSDIVDPECETLDIPKLGFCVTLN